MSNSPSGLEKLISLASKARQTLPWLIYSHLIIVLLLVAQSDVTAQASDAVVFPSAEVELIVGPQLRLTTPSTYFDRVQLTQGVLHGTTFPAVPPAPGADNDSYTNAQYYDLGLCLYALYYRTGDPAHLALARKVTDSWWQFSPIASGTTPIENSLAPRNSSLGGLMLRALDGRPEMWDWIRKYTRYQFDIWIKRNQDADALVYGVRDGSYMLLYATWLGKILPDSFPVAGEGPRNGAELRAGFLADAEKAVSDYYIRLQYPDGSWRWDDFDNYPQADGGHLRGIMQPFMVGLLLHSLIDVYRVSSDQTLKDRIKASVLRCVDHLYTGGPYMTRSAGLPALTMRWRAFNYFYHGGTTVNPSSYASGNYYGFNAPNLDSVEGARQNSSTLLHAFGWAYSVTGDPKYATWGDDIYDSIFGRQEDYATNYVAGSDPKGYNQHYRAAGRYLPWRYGGPPPPPPPSPTPTPTPTAADHLQLNSSTFNVFEGGGSAHLTVERTNSTGAASVDYKSSDTAGLANCNLVNGVASARCDYTLAVGTLRFAPGEKAKSISIPIVDDGYADGNENFSITLSNANGATLGSPSVATITIQDKASNGANPIDGTAFFVRQQYLDFLNREPDPGSYEAWQEIINNCEPGDPNCDRIHVSSAFFRSPEFQDRGYFVYRFYPVAFGRKPNYTEFSPDLARVSVFLGEAELNAAKVAFISEFMSRPEFVRKFNELSDTQYVDTLLATAEVTSPNRDFWIAALGNGTRTRATVLRDISESTEVYIRYYNQAFVVMQYFGYLRRDPDASYLDWIQVLNSSGNFRGMVNGFINSLEYRNRLGR